MSFVETLSAQELRELADALDAVYKRTITLEEWLESQRSGLNRLICDRLLQKEGK